MIFFLNSLGHPIDFEGWFYHFTSSAITPLPRLLVLLSALYIIFITSHRYPAVPWYKTIVTYTFYHMGSSYLCQIIAFIVWFYHFTVVLLFTNSCVNPFIYAGKYREFQDGVRRLMSKLTPDQQQSQVSALS